MKKILLVFGTRPEAIKMAPLVKEFQKYSKNFKIAVCVTAQHREMLDQVLDLFQIIPEYDLNIMSSNQDLYDITSTILLKIKPVLENFNPDVVLVHGDTATTFAVSLASYYQKIKIGHVEAGLRTGDLYSPWPEEGNRRLTSIITDFHFSPTETSKQNLLNEGVKNSSIIVTGNTVIDALQLTLNKVSSSVELKSKIENNIIQSGFKELHSKFLLVTGHRRENFGKGFLNICESLKILAESNPDVFILYPVHLNPNVRKPVNRLLSNINNIKLVEPFQYTEFLYLMSLSYIILTDSGGIQEEAPTLGIPVLLMRDTTERPEAISSGVVKLIGTNTYNIVKESQKLLDNKHHYKEMSNSTNPYGDGTASSKIVNFFRSMIKEEV